MTQHDPALKVAEKAQVPPTGHQSRATGEKILLVSHGRGRRPDIRRPSFRSICKACLAGTQIKRPTYMEPMLRHMAKQHPQLYQKIELWETGTELPNLDGVKAIVFMLKDPLKQLFPRCFADASNLAERAREASIRLVNAPEALSHSIKSVQSRIWLDNNIPTPETIPFSSIDEMLGVAERVTFPVFLRADWLHNQRMKLVSSREELFKFAPDEIPIPGCLTPFVDTRESFRHKFPETEFASFYHKKRVWVFGERVQRAHVFFGRNPIVGCSQSTFSHFKSLNPIRRLRGRVACRKHVSLDNEFFSSPEPSPDIFIKAARALNLEFLALDYSSFADGNIIMWEANPYFSLEQWPLDILVRQRRVRQRHLACHEAIHEFFVTLLESSK